MEKVYRTLEYKLGEDLFQINDGYIGISKSDILTRGCYTFHDGKIYWCSRAASGDFSMLEIESQVSYVVNGLGFDKIVFTSQNLKLVGVPFLSVCMEEMSPPITAIVVEAVTMYKNIRGLQPFPDERCVESIALPKFYNPDPMFPFGKIKAIEIF